MLYFFYIGCVLPEVMVLSLIQWVITTIGTKIINHMVKFKTTLSLGFCLELRRVEETARIISKVLRVATETIRTRWRKLT